MSIRLATNIDALFAHDNLVSSSQRLAQSMERLSSGMRINHSSDDPAGLGISEKMRAQIRGLQQAQRNSQDGISLVQTLDGALSEVHSILQRARDLAVQFNNDTNDPQAKQQIADELASLSDELGRIGKVTAFNGIPLLKNGSTLVTLQIGANKNEIVTFPLATLMGAINSLCNPNDFFLLPFFTADISVFDDDIDRVSQYRSMLGGVQNRLEQSLNAASQYQQNLMQADSQIRDTDVAQEMTEYTKQQILQQSGTSMLRLAMQAPQDLLSLLMR